MIIKKNKLFLVDAYNIIFRYHFAFLKNPVFNSKGINTSIAMGFTSFIIKIIKKEKPTHIAVVFDFHGKNIRKKEYPNYKANRKKTPKEIIISIPLIFKILEALNIKIVYKKGYEADDIIGTLAKKAENSNYIVYILSNDKDYIQLLTNNIIIFNYFNNNNRILDVKEACIKYDINNPIQIIDFLTIIGDKSDNIPGIQGIGKKKAIKIIKKYGNIENIFNNIENIDKKLKIYIINNKNNIFLYKKLITIITNLCLNYEIEEFLIKPINFFKINIIFKKLEFNRLLKIIS